MFLSYLLIIGAWLMVCHAGQSKNESRSNAGSPHPQLRNKQPKIFHRKGRQGRKGSKAVLPLIFADKR